MNRESVWALGLSLSSRVTSAMPEGPRYRLAAGLGRGVSRLFPMKREAVDKNVGHINAYCGTQFTSERVFENFGITLADFLGGQKVEIQVEGRERAEEARSLGRGTIILTTHLGNWELGGRVLSDWGWPVTAVFQPYRSKTMQHFIQTKRAPGLSYLAVGRGAAHGIAKVLRRQGSVAMLADRPFGEDGGWVSVCGRPMRFPRGPFLFASRMGAPVLPGFALMERPGHYRVVVENALWGEGPDPVQNLMDKMAQVLGKYVATHGDQWYCFEPLWENLGNGLPSRNKA
ncbi:MAG: lysophospholipid acyltransferase family protein [Elusimicrobia bacterium]|nr:lysophospholipid acyltransferase family protein [Elusimicrobiota bacterium]